MQTAGLWINMQMCYERRTNFVSLMRFADQAGSSCVCVCVVVYIIHNYHQRHVGHSHLQSEERVLKRVIRKGEGDYVRYSVL